MSARSKIFFLVFLSVLSLVAAAAYYLLFTTRGLTLIAALYARSLPARTVTVERVQGSLVAGAVFRNLECADIDGLPGARVRVQELTIRCRSTRFPDLAVKNARVDPLTVRIIYSPGELEASLAQGSTEGKTKVVCTAPTGTAKYRKNPATRVVFDQSDSGFTAISTEFSPSVGDIVEVVDFVSSKAASVCYLTVTADVIKPAA